jgi:hypothetical protein
MYSKKKYKIIVLIPSYNELKNIKNFILHLSKEIDVIVVDDFSTDRSFEWLVKKKITCIRNKTNLGYEKSIIRGFDYIIQKKKYTHIITLDADGQHNYKDIKKILHKYHNKLPDLIVCNRIKKNRLIEYFISKISKINFGIEDILSGFKIYSISKLKRINFYKCHNFYLVDLALLFKSKKFNIKNYLIKTKKRTDFPKIGNALKVNIKLIKIFFKIFFFH